MGLAWPDDKEWFFSESFLHIACWLNIPHATIGRLQSGIVTKWQPVGTLQDLNDPEPIQELEPEQVPIVKWGKRKQQPYSHEKYVARRDRGLPTVTEEASIPSQ